MTQDAITNKEKAGKSTDLNRKKVKDSKSRQSLKDRAPKRALPYAARTSAIISVCVNAGNTPEKRTVKLPDALKNDPVGLGIIFGLQTRPDKSPVTAYGRVNAIQKFLLFMADNLVADVLPVDIFRIYINELNKRVSQRSTQGIINNISIPLEHAIDSAHFMSGLDIDQKWLIRRVFVAIPSIPRSPGRPRAGLGELFENLPDDRLLFDGLRDYATWAMLDLQAHREELLRSDGVKAALFEARQLVGDDTNALLYKMKKGLIMISKNPSNLCSAVYEAVCRSDSLTLKERLLLGLPDYREHLADANNNVPATREELDAWLDRCRKIRPSNRRPTSAKTILLKFDHCDLRSLVKPIDAEYICLQWLLAGVAVQSSGQQRAQVDGYIIQAGSTYLKYEKMRAKTKHKNTDPIPKKSDMGKAINGFITLKKIEDDNGRLLDKRSYLEHVVSSRPSWRFLLSATFGNSVVRNTFLERHPKGEAILKLLTQLRIHGNLYAQYNNQETLLYRHYPSSKKRSRKLEELKHKFPVTTMKTLNCEAIRRTRISLQEVTPGQSPTVREAEERANATSNAHTVEVFRTVYRNRDNSRHRLKSRADFAEAVGELMVALSEKIGKLKKSTDVLTPENVAEAIGLETGLENEGERATRLLAELEVQGYRLNYFGAAIKGNRRIIVETDVTVALLLDAQESYLNLASDKTATGVQLEEAALEYAVIESIINSMSKRIVDQGRELYKTLTLPPHIIFRDVE
jgi:hypothetical protein